MDGDLNHCFVYAHSDSHYCSKFLTIVPIQNTCLINAKYNNTLSRKYNNTLYGTTNTNRLDIFTLILHNILKILK